MDVLVEEKRFRLVGGSAKERRSGFADEVRSGLGASPKSLSPRYLYDAEGSRLFEQICELPEYYPTRTEASILNACAGELVGRVGPHAELVELGSGSAEKTRILLRAFLATHGRLHFTPIDIAREILAESSRGLLEDFDGLDVEAIVGDYVEALGELARRDEAVAEDERAHRLVLWLGSSIGNLTREEAPGFLRSVHDVIGPSDAMLIGVDHRKGRALLEAAYDDAQGVTARFNKNLLARINRELGGHFDLDAFDHRATYDVEDGRIDMHLVSRGACSIEVDALSTRFDFAAGEAIHTESSYKYSRAEIEELARASGFRIERFWSDDEDRFSLNLFVP